MCLKKFKSNKNIEFQKRTLERGDKNCNVPGGGGEGGGGFSIFLFKMLFFKESVPAICL